MAAELMIARAIGLRWPHPMATRAMNLIFVLMDSMHPRCVAATLVFRTWVPYDQIQFGAIPWEIYLARTAPRQRNNPAARETRERHAIEFDHPVVVSPSIRRIAANAEVDT